MPEFKHYGVLGMKWGVRRTPEQLGHKTLKKSKTSNLDKWGKSPSTNVLYITGISGSGKSTLAKSLSSKNVDTIHLDTYFENESYTRDRNLRSKEFDDYLSKKGIKPPGSVNSKEQSKKDYYTPFEKAIESFGAEQYRKNRRVIAEGIQILDSGLNEDKTFYKDKPIIISKTGAVNSMVRASIRDGFSVESVENAIKYYDLNKTRINDLEAITNAKRGSDWVERYLRDRR